MNGNIQRIARRGFTSFRSHRCVFCYLDYTAIFFFHYVVFEIYSKEKQITKLDYKDESNKLGPFTNYSSSICALPFQLKSGIS